MAELLERISSRELTEWMAYAHLEPFGEERADLRNAINTAVIVNHLRALARAKGRKATIEDFMPHFEHDTPMADELRAKFAAAVGKVDH